MKDPSEWQEDDLQSLIDSGAEESITREFKRSDSLGVPGKPALDEGKKTEISKDVSAMANSVVQSTVIG